MSRRVAGCAVAAAAAFVLVPSSALADQPFSGSASTTTLSLTVSPSALVAVPNSVIAALPSQVSGLLTAALQNISVQVDGAHATGTRAGSALDLSNGHGDVTPVSLQLAPLTQLLGEVHSTLTALWGEVAMPALQSTLANVATITGSSTVMGLLPSTLATELTALNQQLSTLTTQAAGLPNVLTSAVDQLKATVTASLTQGITADLPSSASPNGQTATQLAETVPPAVTLPPLVPSLPVVAKLSPFTATAVNTAGAQHFNVSGPQASTVEGASNINVAPVMNLASLQSALTALQTTLQQVASSISTIAPQLTGVVATTIATVLPGGLDLSALSTQVAAAQGPVGELLQLAQSLQLNALFVCADLGSGSCTVTSDFVIPQGSGVHATSASKLVDLQVLPMSNALLSAAGAPAGTALLDVRGVQATADTFIDGSSGNQTTSSNLDHIAVAGIDLLDNGQINKSALSGHVPALVLNALPDALPPGQTTTIPVSTPAGTLTVVITLGAAQTQFTSASHRSAALTKLEIKLVNGAPDGTSTVGGLGLMGAGTVATLDVGMVASEVLGNATLVPVNSSNATLQATGMFGPGSLVVGLLLLGGGVGLRRVTSRRRRGRSGA